MLKSTLATCCIVLGLLIMSPNAHAASIYNLSEKPQEIEIKTGNVFVEKIIEPGRKYDAHGNMIIRFNGREMSIEHDMEYAIWPDGLIGPQFKRPNSRKMM